MTQRKKLIEVAMPLDIINKAAVREKSITQGHPSTFHLWWARRPLAACRAVLFAQLTDDPSSHPKKFPTEDAIQKERKRLFAIIEEMVQWKNLTNESVLDKARAEIQKSLAYTGSDSGSTPPPPPENLRIYDPFSGGGSIPLEAQRLGLTARGSDLNPVAVIIGKAMIEIPPKFRDRKPVHPDVQARLPYSKSDGLAEDILYYAEILRSKAEAQIGHLYPKVTLEPRDGGGEAGVLAWIWVRTVPTPSPALAGAPVPLLRSYWICKKPNKKVWAQPRIHGSRIQFRVATEDTAELNEEIINRGNKTGRGANFTCLLTGDAITADYVKQEARAGRMGWQLLAIVAEGRGGRRYVSPDAEHEQTAFSEQPKWRPDFPISPKIGVTNYGMNHWSDVFMDRQTIALNTFVDLIPAVVKEINAEDAYRDAITTYLALGVSRLANRQSTHTFWNSGSEIVEQVFAIQNLPMRYETAEANPFSSSSGNFMGQIKYLCKALINLPAKSTESSLVQKDAREVDFSGCVISTDPPYYDSVPYANLSDFFYVWLRKALKDLYPDLFETLLTSKDKELVVDTHRHGDRRKSDAFFLEGMQQVMGLMAKQARADIPAALYYAFRQTEEEESGRSSRGWLAFLQAVMDAGYQIDATWPIRTELIGKLKKTRNVLATSVVLACRPRPKNAESITRVEFLKTLQRDLPKAIETLDSANITPVDMPQAAIGPGMAVFSRYKSVLEIDDSSMTVKTALQLINEQLDEFLNQLEGEFDQYTRFAVTWFKQHGWQRSAFGAADSLARFRGISVDDLAEIADSKSGQVRLLSRSNLPGDWFPGDKRHDSLIIWQLCQHAIKKLEDGGEMRAAPLLQNLSGETADMVRKLARYLHDLCLNRRQDAAEANAYNSLIAAWDNIMSAGINEWDWGLPSGQDGLDFDSGEDAANDDRDHEENDED